MDDTARDLLLSDADRRRLRDEVANLYPDSPVATRMLEDIGLERSRQPLWERTGNPIGWWAAVFAEFDRGIVETPYRRLLLTALAEYQSNGILREIARRHGVVPPLGRRPVLPHATAAPLGHVALRRPLADFTNREQQIAEIGALLTDRLRETVPVVVLYGMGGVGKTALANHVAHRLAPVFSYARILVDLGGGVSEGTTDNAVIQVLQAFGLFGDALPGDPQQRWHTYQRLLRGGPSLLVLDNAAGGAQVAPLLPDVPGSAAIVTSRSALTSLEGADRRLVGPLLDAEGLRLFKRIVDAAAPVRDEPAAEMSVVSLLGGLPLAIRAAAAAAVSPALRRRSLQFLAQRLQDEQTRLAHLGSEEQSVRSSFDISYRSLRPDTARLFRCLGLLAGLDFAADVAASAAGVPLEHAEELLGVLVDYQLLEVTRSAGARYQLHDLLRLYAAERASAEDSASERKAVSHRAAEWYASRMAAWMSRPGAHEQPPAEALEWFMEEHLNVHASLRAAHQDREWDLVLRLAASLYGLLVYRGLWEEMEAAKAWAAEAAREKQDPLAELGSLIHLAEARRALGRPHETGELYERALEIARSAQGGDSEGWVLTHYGDLECDLGRPDQAFRRYAEAEALYRERGDAGAQIWLAAHMADAYQQFDRPGDGVRVQEEALAWSRERGDPAEIAWCQWHLALAYNTSGRFAEAEAALSGAIGFHRRADDRGGLATMLVALARIHLGAGRPEQAREALTEALDLVRSIGAPRREAEINAILTHIGNASG